jgi:beta-aspartyl-peptidase (threonine type)
MKKSAIAIHGGAGTLVKGMMTSEKEIAYRNGLQEALEHGYKVLDKGATAVDAVEAAVIALENNPLFNAGKGSVFSAQGAHEMDASIMDGASQDAGAVSLIQGIKNPISLAKTVLLKSDHVFLAGEGAHEFAKSNGFSFEENFYFHDDLRYQQWQEIKDSDQFQLDHSKSKDHKFGTVGAVALDNHGNIAAATSTGGMTNKKFGRVGDSPMIGAGNYANNNTCAISCTGSGEFFIRGVVAYDVSCLMEYKGLSLAEASDMVIQDRIKKIGGDGGLIGIDSEGNISMPFNTEGMYRGYMRSPEDWQVKIYKD